MDSARERLEMGCGLSRNVVNMTKRRNSTLLWSRLDGVQCRIAAYGEDQCQLMLQWHEETIRTAVVSGYAGALSTSRMWRQEWDTKASATGSSRSVQPSHSVASNADGMSAES
jgi:hypothetical protein